MTQERPTSSLQRLSHKVRNFKGESSTEADSWDSIGHAAGGGATPTLLLSSLSRRLSYSPESIQVLILFLHPSTSVVVFGRRATIFFWIGVPDGPRGAAARETATTSSWTAVVVAVIAVATMGLAPAAVVKATPSRAYFGDGVVVPSMMLGVPAAAVRRMTGGESEWKTRTSKKPVLGYY